MGKKVDIFWNIISSKGCKWSNAPSTETELMDGRRKLGLEIKGFEHIEKTLRRARGSRYCHLVGTRRPVHATTINKGYNGVGNQNRRQETSTVAM